MNQGAGLSAFKSAVGATGFASRTAPRRRCRRIHVRLYDYWRSSAAYRVRIALNLKGLTYQQVPVDLRAGGQRAEGYLAVNPQGLVPYLQDDAIGLSQSMAIMEYLEETPPDPALMPRDSIGRAQVRQMAMMIVADIHPLNNSRVLAYLER